MRHSPLLLLTLLAGCSSEGSYSITGSAKLPDCSEPPQRDLTGRWFDEGTLTITSSGCEDLDAPLGSVFESCPLDWELSQDGTEVDIVIDYEYALEGRMCGDTLHLQGGWWLPLEDDAGQCNYDDDDGEEVGIETGGSALSLQDDPDFGELLAGTLVVKGPCTGDYLMTLRPAGK